MPVFVYRAADRRGQTIDGVMGAPDAGAVVERLQKDAYYPIRVAPHAERTAWLAFGRSSRGGPRGLPAVPPPPRPPFEGRAGEKGGVLEITLRRLAEFLEARAAFAAAVFSALAYPAFIILVGIGAI